MPELPEVETTLRGIQPHVKSYKILKIIVRQHQLRWPIPNNISTLLQNQTLISLERRGKYLLLNTTNGTLIFHLGMSGSLRILSHHTPSQKHDHLDIEFNNHKILRLTDPRRFGACLWTNEDPLNHPLIRTLGPEPLSKQFSGKYLWAKAQKRKLGIKSFIMNSRIVVGVGNIYATEALFAAGIHPNQPSSTISEKQYARLVTEIKKILQKAIKKGGTTLKDFVDSEGKPGYFSMHLKVYGRDGLPCVKCKTILEKIRLGQRGTVFCHQCQPLLSF